jgi:hypothetical protein
VGIGCVNIVNHRELLDAFTENLLKGARSAEHSALCLRYQYCSNEDAERAVEK